MIRVYTASKLSTAVEWRQMQLAWPTLFFHARWLRHVEIGTPDSPENAVRFWIEDQEDVASADAVLVYAKRDEHLRGALVEAGIAIACGIPVIVIGEHRDYGTWQYHPGVMRVGSFIEAEQLLKQIEEDKYAE